MREKNDVQRLEKKIKEAKGELEKWKKKLNKKDKESPLANKLFCLS